jgi:hypothetical protein
VECRSVCGVASLMPACSAIRAKWSWAVRQFQGHRARIALAQSCCAAHAVSRWLVRNPRYGISTVAKLAQALEIQPRDSCRLGR